MAKHLLSDRRLLLVTNPQTQTLRTYFQFITPYIVSVLAFHNDIYHQCDTGFHVRPRVTFFGDPECTYKEQEIPISPQHPHM